MKKAIIIILAIAILMLGAIGLATSSDSTLPNATANKNDATTSATAKKGGKMPGGTSDDANTKTTTKAYTVPEVEIVPDYSAATKIVLGDTITINGQGASASGSIVTITTGGSFSISGTLTNGMVNVNTDEKVYIELDGVFITNNSSAALLITNAKKAVITLKAGTTSTLTDGGKDAEFDAVLFSNDTIVINGEGTLVADGKNMEGISSDDDIIIQSGTVKVTAPDDGMNAHDDITISGGYVYINSEGDGIDSNGTIHVTGGKVISLSGLTDASGGIDANGDIVVSGGTVLATGSNVETPGTSSTQKSLLVNFSGTQQANTLVSIQKAGAAVVTFAPVKEYQQFFYSAPEIVEGQSYDVYSGGSATGTSVDGLYSATTYTPGTLVTSLTTDSVTENSRRMGPGGQRPDGQLPNGAFPGGKMPDGRKPTGPRK